MESKRGKSNSDFLTMKNYCIHIVTFFEINKAMRFLTFGELECDCTDFTDHNELQQPKCCQCSWVQSKGRSYKVNICWGVGLWENTSFPVYCDTSISHSITLFQYRFIGKYALVWNLGSGSTFHTLNIKFKMAEKFL